MSSKSERSMSKSPKRGRSGGKSGGGKSASNKSSRRSGSSSVSPSRTKSRGADSSTSPSRAKSRGSASSKADGLSGLGKPSSITSRRARGLASQRGLETLDLSGQGMTTLGGNLFSRKNIGELDLSSNNLRVIPPEIRKLSSLVHIDLSRNGIRCGHSQDFGGLPKELASLPSLEVLIISECNLPFIPPAIWTCQNLKVLDISRNKINVLPPDIGHLEKLQHLNAQQTSIMTLPPEIALCQELEEIMLWGNVIESLPETLKELPKLDVLAINYRSFSSTVDSYREGLLKKGQIQSEHIPPVLFEMPALDGLDLNETKLNTLPEECIGKLTEFHVANNYFMKLPSIVVTMVTLKVLDISGNMITQLPEDIGNLTNLTSLKLDNNKINAMPPTLSKLSELTHLSMGGNKLHRLLDDIGSLCGLHTLILDRNSLQALPESIIQLTQLQTLDLTDNKIRSLPINFYKMQSITTAHTYQKLHKHGLWLHKNPLDTPPAEVWKTEDPTRIYSYLKRLQIQRTENLQRQKLFLMGNSQCGKTSLMHAMTTGKSAMTEGVTASTSMVEFIAWTTDNGVDFLIHDLGGMDVYKSTHYLFLDPKAIYVIVYDHPKFNKERFDETLGCWLEMLRLHVPGAIVKIVGTQIDLCSPEVREAIELEMDKELKANIDARSKKISASIASIDKLLSDPELTSQEQDHIKQQKFKLVALKKQSLRLLPTSLVSSAEGINGVLTLVNDLELAAVDKTLCPHAQRVIPESWLAFRLALKAKKDLCLTIDNVKRVAKSKKFPRDQITDCLRFLSECGDIIWFWRSQELRHLIFHRPQKLVQILKGFFRHDLDCFLDYDSNQVFKCKGQMGRDEFDKSRYMFESAGQISRGLLQCLWFYLRLTPLDFDYLLELMPTLDLCYVVPQPAFPAPRSHFTPLMVVPAFCTDPLPSQDALTDCWPYPLPPGQCQLTVTAAFPVLPPQGLFEKICCRLQDLVTYRVDWCDVVYGELDVGAVLLRQQTQENSQRTLDVQVRGVDLKNTRYIMSELWSHVLAIIHSYEGLVWTAKLAADNCDSTPLKDCFSANIFLVDKL